MTRAVGTKNRTQQQILKDRRDIARRYLKGYPLKEIGEKIGLEIPTINKEIAEIKATWIQSTLIDFNEVQGAALHKLDMLEEKCIEKFAASEKERRTTTQKRIPIMKDEEGKLYVDTKGKLIIEQLSPDYIVVEETIKKEENVGDIRWLSEIRSLLDMRLKILGLYNQPTKDTDGPAGRVRIAQENTKGKTALLLALITEWDDSTPSGGEVSPK